MTSPIETFFGTLVIEKELKSNSHNSVYLARNTQIIRQCIYREFTGSAEVYRILEQLHSPHLPEIYAVKENDGQVCVLEEYVQGDTLAFLLEDKSLPEQTAGEILCQLCDALSLLHKAGVVHRDIKPENILLRGSMAVLIDFDVSRMVKPEHSTDTQIMGTTGYAAPEQYGFSQTDARADIYALGILLNEMLTRQHPSKRLVVGRFRPVIERCIEVNVDKRYASVDDLQKAVRRAMEVKSGKPLLLGAAAGAAAMLLLLTLIQPGKQAPAPDIPTDAAAAAVSEPETLPPTEESEFSVLGTYRLQPVEVPETPWSGSARGFTTPFSYDLDGDGATEQYIFGTLHANVPAEHRNTPSDSFGLAGQETNMRNVFPCVWRQETDGRFTQVKEFADLLTDPQTTLWRIEGTDSQAPEVFLMDDIWKGGVSVVFSLDNTGMWLFAVSATLDGQQLTAATTSYVYDMQSDS